MKKHFKKILLATIIIIALFFGYRYFFMKTETTPEFREEIITVSTGSIKDSITAVWNATLVDEQNLSFRIVW